MPILLLLYLLVACFWSGSFVAIKWVIEAMPPLFGAAVRVVIAGIAVGLYYRLQRKPLRVPVRAIPKVWLAGLFAQGIPFSFLFWGEQHVSAGLAGIFNGTTPIWVFLLGLLFLRDVETFTLKKWIGLTIGLVGLCTIFGPMVHFGTSPLEFWGALAVWGMAVCYAIASLMNRVLLTPQSGVAFEANVFHQNVASALYLLIVSFLLERPSLSILPNLSWQVWTSLLYLGICSTAFAWIVYFNLIKSWGVIKASTIGYIVPVLTLLWDYLVFHHVPTLFQTIGILLILVGVGLIKWPEKK